MGLILFNGYQLHREIFFLARANIHSPQIKLTLKNVMEHLFIGKVSCDKIGGFESIQDLNQEFSSSGIK